MSYAFVVTTDFSRASRAAFEAASELARRFDAPLYLLHVTHPPEIHSPWQLEAGRPSEVDRQAGVKKRLEDLVLSERAFEGLHVVPRILSEDSGDAADAVHRFQQLEQVELIVLSHHGDMGSRCLPVGSLTARILERVSCPVLVLPASASESDNRPAFRPRQILVACDLSGMSRSILDTARSWGRKFEASVRVVFVVEKSEGLEKLRSEGLTRLQALVGGKWEGVPLETVARVGSPATEILRESRRFGADLVILGSRGLPFPERFRVGSVAERAIQEAPCPALVIKSRQKGVPAPEGTWEDRDHATPGHHELQS